MATYKHPDVYVEEISKLPPSVAEVSTAIPAFIGCTANGPTGEAVRISTFLEYKNTFGGAQTAKYTIATEGTEITDVSAEWPTHTLYHSLDLYFRNGGGPCYIISIGNYAANVSAQNYIDALAALRKEDEPTLIVMPDAHQLGATYGSVGQAALTQCNELKDRFCIFDVAADDTDGKNFREAISSPYLKYGAAYTPYLQTALTHAYDEKEVTIKAEGFVDTVFSHTTGTNAIKVTYQGTNSSPKLRINKGTAGTIEFDVNDERLTIKNVGEGATVTSIVEAWNLYKNANDTYSYNIAAAGSGSGTVTALADTTLQKSNEAENNLTLDQLLDEDNPQTALYNKIVKVLGNQRVVLPPSPAMAGIYAAVDRDRGVWKAPANVPVASVIQPMEKITNEQQDRLNIDPTGGKSINAIRAFSGQGTLVWGARTLDGNSNEWRYISVRRLFNMIEESCKKATNWAVFEPNDASTWLKVKGMIDSYLYNIWERGALMGAEASQAYFVNVGLGTTMTPDDINEGRMNVDIGIAAVRPAEFIILRFSHKLVEA